MVLVMVDIKNELYSRINNLVKDRLIGMRSSFVEKSINNKISNDVLTGFVNECVKKRLKKVDKQ